MNVTVPTLAECGNITHNDSYTQSNYALVFTVVRDGCHNNVSPPYLIAAVVCGAVAVIAIIVAGSVKFHRRKIARARQFEKHRVMLSGSNAPSLLRAEVAENASFRSSNVTSSVQMEDNVPVDPEVAQSQPSEHSEHSASQQSEESEY